jgi:RNA polymerase sigma factor (TIGR02999 family)
VHEAYLKFSREKNLPWEDHAQFLGLASHVMRRVLVEHARARQRLKRGDGRHRTTLSGIVEPSFQNQELDIVALDTALRKLAEVDPRASQVVEMRFFGGMTESEVARAMGVATRTVQNDWTHARAWLSLELQKRS